MIDELTSLVADSIEADSVAESASNTLPAPDFTGSLDYIDSLASRSAIAISRRDVLGITAGLSLYDYSSPSYTKRAPVRPGQDDISVSMTDFRPLQDRRLFNPQGSDQYPAGLSRSATRLVSPSVTRARIATPEHPYTPSEVEEILRSKGYRDATRNPFSPRSRAFSVPDRTVICLKRKLRRSMMFASGFGGLTGFRRSRRSFWSRVLC